MDSCLRQSAILPLHHRGPHVSHRGNDRPEGPSGTHHRVGPSCCCSIGHYQESCRRRL